VAVVVEVVVIGLAIMTMMAIKEMKVAVAASGVLCSEEVILLKLRMNQKIQ
jgi:hypothetical protein